MKLASILLVFLIATLAFPLFNVEVAKAQETGVFGNPSLPDWLDVTVSEDSDFVVVDNADGFVWKFRKGTVGTTQILQNGVVIVEEEQWFLQYLFQSKWKDRGQSQYVIWEQPQPYHVVVKRFYRDWGEPETTFNVTYSFYGGFRPKISLEAEIGQADTYRVKWSISGIHKTYAENEPGKHHVKFWNSDEEAVCFDYLDVYESFGDVTDIELDVWAGDHKLNEIFNVGALELGEFGLDPNFGYETKGDTATGIEDTIVGSLYTISESGTAQNITVYLSCTVKAKNAKCAIYKHSDLSLVGVTEQLSIAIGFDDWKTFNFGEPKPSLSVSTDYILVVWGESDAGLLNAYYNTGGTVDQCHFSSTPYNSYPPTWEPTHWGDKQVSIYCTYSTEEEGEKSFTLSETVSVTATGTQHQEAAFTKTEASNIVSSLLWGKEKPFAASATTNALSQFTWGKEKLFAITGTVIIEATKTFTKETLAFIQEIMETVSPTDTLSVLQEKLFSTQATTIIESVKSFSKEIVSFIYEISETVQPISTIQLLEEKLGQQIGSVIVESTKSFSKEIVSFIYEISETVEPIDTLTMLLEKRFLNLATIIIESAKTLTEEVTLKAFEFIESVNPIATITKTIQEIAAVVNLPLVLAAFACVMAIIALALTFTRRREEPA